MRIKNNINLFRLLSSVFYISTGEEKPVNLQPTVEKIKEQNAQTSTGSSSATVPFANVPPNTSPYSDSMWAYLNSPSYQATADTFYARHGYYPDPYYYVHPELKETEIIGLEPVQQESIFSGENLLNTQKAGETITETLVEQGVIQPVTSTPSTLSDLAVVPVVSNETVFTGENLLNQEKFGEAVEEQVIKSYTENIKIESSVDILNQLETVETGTGTSRENQELLMDFARAIKEEGGIDTFNTLLREQSGLESQISGNEFFQMVTRPREFFEEKMIGAGAFDIGEYSYIETPAVQGYWDVKKFLYDYPIYETAYKNAINEIANYETIEGAQYWVDINKNQIQEAGELFNQPMFQFKGDEGLYTKSMAIYKLTKDFEPVQAFNIEWSTKIEDYKDYIINYQHMMLSDFEYMSEKATWDYKGEQKTFEELKQLEPALYLTQSTSGEYQLGYDYLKWRKESESNLGLGEKVALGLSEAVNAFDPRIYFAGHSEDFVVSAKTELAKRLYETSKVMQGEDVWAKVGAWAGVQIPVYENVILPLAGGALIGKALPYITKAGTALLRASTTIGGQVLGHTMELFPYVAGGVFLGVASSNILTASQLEGAGLVPKGATYGRIASTALQVSMAGIGYGLIADTTVSISGLESKVAPLEAKLSKAYGRVSDVFDIFTSGKYTETLGGMKTAVSEFKLTGIETKWNMAIASKISMNELWNVEQYSIKPSGISDFGKGTLELFGILEKTNINLPDYVQSAYESAGFKSLFIEPRGGWANIPADWYYRGGERPTMFPYESYSYFAQPSLESHIDIIALQKEMVLHIPPAQRNIDVQTETLLFKNIPQEDLISIVSHVKDTENYLIGIVKKEGDLYRFEGDYFWKLATGNKPQYYGEPYPENVFWQQMRVTGDVGSKYVGEFNDWVAYETVGRQMMGEYFEINPQTTKALFDLSGQIEPTMFKNLFVRWQPETVSGSYGYSFLKTYAGGGGVPTKTGFVSSGFTDYDIGIALGYYSGELAYGKYLDVSLTLTKKIGAKEIFTEPSVFDVGKLVTKPISETTFSPGGIGVSMEQMIGMKYPLDLFEMFGNKTKFKITPTFEEDYVSSFWTGVSPYISSNAFLSTPKIGQPSGLGEIPGLSSIVSQGSINISKVRLGNMSVPIIGNISSTNLGLINPNIMNNIEAVITSQVLNIGSISQSSMVQLNQSITESLNQTIEVNISETIPELIPVTPIPEIPEIPITPPFIPPVIPPVIPPETPTPEYEPPEFPEIPIIPLPILGQGGDWGVNASWGKKKRFRKAKTIDPFADVFDAFEEGFSDVSFF